MARNKTPLIKLRCYQLASWKRRDLGIMAKIARRQCGKTHEMGATSLYWMMQEPGVTVLYMSAIVRLSKETLRRQKGLYNSAMAALRTEQNEARRRALEAAAEEAARFADYEQGLRTAAADWRQNIGMMRVAAQLAGQQIRTNADDDKGRLLDADALMDLLERQALETRLHFDNTGGNYSVTKAIAANPDTAVGESGYLIMDEVGRIKDFLECFEAAKPFATSNPAFRIRLVTTPPPDDAHPSYELLAPPEGMEFTPNAEGNWYKSAAGIWVHRVDAFDTDLAGVPLYDDETRLPITPAEHRAKEWDKAAWDRNYGCQFIRGGTSAIAPADLTRATADCGTAVAITDTLTHLAA